MKKLLIKWICKECPEHIEDISKLYLPNPPKLNEHLSYLYKDDQGNDSYVILNNGKYLYHGYVVVIEKELVIDFYTK